MASATIHTDETLDSETRATLKLQLDAHKGVRTCSSHDKSPHMLIVDYDADVVTGHELIEFVQETGVNARMVG